MCASAASTPTPCRSTPIAAPGGRRPPTSSSASSTVRRASSGRRRRAPAAELHPAASRCPTRRRSAIAPTTPAISTATWKGPWSSPIGRASRSALRRVAQGAARLGASGSPPTSNARPGAKARTREVRLEEDGTVDRLLRHAIERAGPRDGLCAVRRRSTSTCRSIGSGSCRATRRGSATGHGTGGSRSIPIGGVSVARRVAGPRRASSRSSPPTSSKPRSPISRSRTARCGSSAPTGGSPSPELAALAEATPEQAAPAPRASMPPDATYPERHPYRRGRDRPGHRRDRDRRATPSATISARP